MYPKIKASKFRNFKVTQFQSFNISKFQSFKISKFQNFKVPEQPKFGNETTRIANTNPAFQKMAHAFSNNFKFLDSSILNSNISTIRGNFIVCLKYFYIN